MLLYVCYVIKSEKSCCLKFIYYYIKYDLKKKECACYAIKIVTISCLTIYLIFKSHLG